MSDELFQPPRSFAGISPQEISFDEARIAVLPVPYDSTTEYKSGTREGPQAIIDASYYLEQYDAELELDINEIGVYTLPEVQPMMSGPEHMIARVYQITNDLLEKGKLPAMFGGEHSITLGAVRACTERYPDLSVLHLDAHT
ncbi:MAG: arginase family protein, partial [Dehalococcoidia bacterium]